MTKWLRIFSFLVGLGLVLANCRPTDVPPSSRATSLPTASSPPVPPSPGKVITEPYPTSRPSRTSLPTARPSPTPSPTVVPWSGWLVFSSLRPDTTGEITSHLYKINLADGTTTQLTFGDNNDVCPAWSPDGNHIVFASDRAGKGSLDLFVINSDGSGLVQLTDTPEDETTPAWSPDGRYIAYITRTPAEWGIQEQRVHLLSIAEHTSQQLTYGPGNDRFPDWSPDGRYLAFGREETVGDPPISLSFIYIWEVETGSFTRLEFPREPQSAVIDYSYPRWLPREDNLLSVSRNEYGGDTVESHIVIFEVEEYAGEIVLHQTPAIMETNFGRYTWGPGGEWLIAPVWVWTAGPQTYNLLRVRIRLTGESRACWQCTDLLDAEFLTTGDHYDDWPDWTP